MKIDQSLQLDHSLLNSLEKNDLSIEEYVWMYSIHISGKEWFKLNPKLMLELEQKGFVVFKTLTDKFYELIGGEVTYTPEFETFWKTYPLTDKYSHFPKTRTLRVSKEQCFIEYKKLCEKYTPSQILSYLCDELNLARQNSRVSNQLKYFKSSLRYLKEFSLQETDVEKTFLTELM